MRSTCRHVFVLLTALALLYAPHARAGETPEAKTPRKLFFWEARKDDRTVYLLGSIHLGKAEMYPLDRAIMEAFDRASVLAVEIDITDLSAMTEAAAVQHKQYYPAGMTLRDDVAPATFALLEKYCAARELRVEDLTGLRPWYLMMHLTNLEAARHGYSAYFGIDHFFLLKAKSAGKRIVQLESARFQIDMLAGFSSKLQEALLAKTLADADTFDREMQAMIRALQAGDTAALETLALEALPVGEVMDEFRKKMLEKRNRGMAVKIERLAAARPLFVVVGAAHFVGPNGIPALLEKKGFAVNQADALGPWQPATAETAP